MLRAVAACSHACKADPPHRLSAAALALPPPHCAQWTIHPWVHNSCNQLTLGDQLRGVQVPDVHPAALVPAPGLLSMTAGDFVDVYRAPEFQGAFDALAAWCAAACAAMGS